jgi:hypothetical protein
MPDCFARGEGPDLFFKRMRKSPTIELPIHLDVNVPDREGRGEPNHRSRRQAR